MNERGKFDSHSFSYRMNLVHVNLPFTKRLGKKNRVGVTLIEIDLFGKAWRRAAEYGQGAAGRHE